MSKVVLPGSQIGVLGSGQLGRMFAISARQMGYRVQVLSPDDDTPTGQVADAEITAHYDDLAAIAAFAQSVEVVTFEFENVPAATADAAARYAPLRPGGHVLHTTQNRLREKTFLQQQGLPVTNFCAIRSPADVVTAASTVGTPSVLKTASWGYDGKGQIKLAAGDSIAAAWEKLGHADAVLERWVDLQAELSVIAVRGVDGGLCCYEPIRNVHRNHILDVSSVPAGLSPAIEQAAEGIALAVMTSLDVVGVLCVEFFLTTNDELLINELAPRPHNSGHLTINAHQTSQFEQQVRAACGLPLGATDRLRPAAMINLLGDVWEAGPPNWVAACQDSSVHLHLYGKREPRVGRKMGHLTVLADSAEEAIARGLAARDRLATR
ncbi:MAG: 5-(carboxyamino)imidazole ribonucleotide synthase [Planctomycetota bacterium]